MTHVITTRWWEQVFQIDRFVFGIGIQTKLACHLLQTEIRQQCLNGINLRLEFWSFQWCQRKRQENRVDLSIRLFVDFSMKIFMKNWHWSTKLDLPGTIWWKRKFDRSRSIGIDNGSWRLLAWACEDDKVGDMGSCQHWSNIDRSSNAAFQCILLIDTRPAHIPH